MTQNASREEILSFVAEQLLGRIRGGPASIDPNADLIELGVRSIDAVIVSGDIEDRFEVEVEPVLLFECRTLNRVADSVLELLARK